MSPLPRFFRDNGLSLAFGGAFLLGLAGQAVAGHADFNNRLITEGLQPDAFRGRLRTSDFAVDVTENRQSEFLQFFLCIFGTGWLLQRGSPESKRTGEAGLESDGRQKTGRYAREGSPRRAAAGGFRQPLYSRSLGLVMGLVFLLSWLAQSVTGNVAHNGEQLRALQAPVGWGAYLLSADFWNRALRNWQSELLAVASMVILPVCLRQCGSPESEPVGAPHRATDVEG